jgi:hypothetical protein
VQDYELTEGCTVDKHNLVEILEEILAKDNANLRADDAGFMPYSLPREFVKGTPLLRVLTEIPELEIFNEKVMNLGTSKCTVHLEDLASWLIGRAFTNGAKLAVEDLQKYIDINLMPIVFVLAVSGIKIHEMERLSDEIELVPFSDLSNHLTLSSLKTPQLKNEKFFPGFSASPPLIAIITRSELKPKYYDRYEMEKPSKDLSSMDEIARCERLLYEACECLTLVGPSTPVPVAIWSKAEEWVPCANMLGEAWSNLIHDVISNKEYQFEHSDIERAREIYKSFFELSEETRDRLRVPIVRLNQALRRISLADAAIDLGIALEALLVHDRGPLDPIAFPMRLRGAWLLGDNLAKRKVLLEMLRNLYVLRSQAVHTGKVDAVIKGTATVDLLGKGFELCVEAIEKIIRDGGFPEWDSIILGD